MGRHSGTSDTYSDAYAETPADAYAHPHAGAYAGAGQEQYGDPGHGSGEYALPAGAYYATTDTSGAYAQVGHGYAGENAYAAPGHPGGQYQPYQESGYLEPAAFQDPAYHESAYQDPAYYTAGVPDQGGYAAYVPQTQQAPQQPYWDDPAAWETAPADPFHDTGGQPAYDGRQGQAFHQAGTAYPPGAYPAVYDQPAPHPTPQPALEPEFDPEPAAWREAVRIEPVDDEPLPTRRRARAAAPAGGAFAPLADEPAGTLLVDTDAPADADDAADRYVPRTAPAGGSGSGRAASRRASRTPSRKPRRIAAAGGAVVTGAVLAGVVVVQMPDSSSQGQASGDTARQDTQTRDTQDAASRDSERGQVQAVPTAATPGPSTIPLPTPSAPQNTTDRLKLRYDLDPLLSLSGKFDSLAVQAGTTAKAGTKTKTYRIEIEQGLALDGNLFAETVQQTLNDPRSWAHDGRSFVQTGGSDADFVIRLASPGTTHRLCGVVGLDTSEDNVSCDAAGTPYVVINAWRWAQGSETFGDEMVAYRQMLINHEVGHRLGRNHETEACQANDLAPVMMQQTKSLEADNGLVCKPNAWPYPA